MQNDPVADSDRVLTSLSDIVPRLGERRIKSYMAELFTWNPTLGLISKRDPIQTAARLIRVAVNLWDFMEKELSISGFAAPLRMIDIGSGGGFPGLVWKLLEDRICIDLVERSERKHAFLERTIRLLSLGDANAVYADAQDLAVQPSFRETYRIATMLAVSSPEKMAKTVESLLSPSGYFVTIRGSGDKVIKEVIGQHLHIRKAVSSDDGIHVIYEKSS
jgi:16S rRNA (guanine(527)-N(7))-methyltransferase RsmG